MKIILVFIPLFLLGCANCNTFIPQGELAHYYWQGAIQGMRCNEKYKSTGKIGTINECLQKQLDKDYKYFKEFHTTVYKYKIFEEVK